MEEKVLVKSEPYNIGKKLCRFLVVVVGICVILSVASFAMALLRAVLECECDTRIICPTHDYYSSAVDRAISGSSFICGMARVFAITTIIISLIIYIWMRSYEMTVTNKRVYGKAAFGKRVDLPVDSVSAIGTTWFNGIAVATSSGKIAFLMIKNRDEIHKCVSDLLIERQSKVAATPTTTIKQEIPQSNAEELKKYKELLDSGVISQEEFDAKKKQLLGL